MRKLVSVVIPTYSRAEFIERAVESVLKQTYLPIEIIVVDDNGIGTKNQLSTQKKLAKYIDSGKIKYIAHDTNKNGSAARNTGAKNALGEFITFLDDDDELLPQKIEKQVNAIETHPGYSGSYTGFRIIKNDKILKEVKSNLNGNLQYELLALQWGIGTGSNPLFKKEAFDSICGYDESFTRHQDLEFLVRFFRNHTIISIQEVLINRFIDSRINSVNYQKFAEVKNKFLCTFNQDINTYPSKQQKTILRNQYADLACHAIQSHAYRISLKYYIKACSFKMLSLKIIAKAFLFGFCGRKVE